MRRLYGFLLYLVTPFAFTLLLWRGLRERGYWAGLGERFGFGPSMSGSPVIWVHAVSLGEVTAAGIVIRALRRRHPQYRVLLTTATPTGRARAGTVCGEDIAIRFLPYDTPGSVARFFRRIQPRLALIMETELWPNLFLACERAGVPLVLASARLSAKSVSRYRRLGRLISGVFSANTLIAAQSAQDAERFIEIGADSNHTQVIGNVKFDLQIGAAVIEQGRALRRLYGVSRPVWTAGSTHAGEEAQVLNAHALLLSERSDALLLLVPRHPDRFASVAELLARRGLRFQARSGGEALHPDTQVLLVDTVGELVALYGAADVAFVGGSLVPIGGHNLLEPAALGLPVITGPHNANGKDIAHSLLQQGAALQVADAVELAAQLSRLFADPVRRRQMGEAARAVIARNRGSVERLLDLIDPLLAAPPRAAR